MRDPVLVRFDEPFTSLLTQGMVLYHIYSYQAGGERKRYFNPDAVDEQRCTAGTKRHEVVTAEREALAVEHEGLGTMSKSKGNGVDPEGIVQRFGADTARLFIMSASPPEQTLEWSGEGVQGAFRQIRRLWSAVYEHAEAGAAPPLERRSLSEPQR